MIEPMTFGELSNFVKQIGFSYLAGLGIILSGLIPGFQRTSDSGENYADAIAAFRRQKFGWGAEEKYSETATKSSLFQNVLGLIVLATIAFFMWFLMNRLHYPILSLAAGVLMIIMAINIRRNFRKRWSGSMLEFDFGSIAIGLLFLLSRI
ncbi:hypothetical protein [Ruegeria atlantica]|uniref:Uncharacterized protein n=1 Tax=Ruegeria atlantica TaxID=81569 RepID=A0ABX1W600_9RHOB|nr:hypothetical protein [Ruegeria atlantica]NOD29337.1 hypothetical protein [Ruegeria atlantica]